MDKLWLWPVWLKKAAPYGVALAVAAAAILILRQEYGGVDKKPVANVPISLPAPPAPPPPVVEAPKVVEPVPAPSPEPKAAPKGKAKPKGKPKHG